MVDDPASGGVGEEGLSVVDGEAERKTELKSVKYLSDDGETTVQSLVLMAGYRLRSFASKQSSVS